MSEPILDANDLLTPDQLAERLKVSRNWVYEQSRARGRDGSKPLPFVKCGRYLRFIWPDVVDWLRESGK
jgi:helix-turn-helix protein